MRNPVKTPVFIIEHLEPELGKWCLMEYKHISSIAGSGSLWFTNVKNSKDAEKLKKFGKVFRESIASIKLENACVLDPEADKTLDVEEAGRFDFFIFGGILGNYPPEKRTRKQLTSRIKYKVEKRSIGRGQMSTDNAAYTVKKIIEGKKLTELKFKDILEIPINKILTIELPYRYNLVKRKPLISRELLKHIRKTESKN